jgi:hypothetical protein
MKTTQRGGLWAAAIFVILFGLVAALRGQTDGQSGADNPLQPVALTNVTDRSAFFKMSEYIANGGSLGGPYPFMPDTNAPMYSLYGDMFLVDDAVVTNDSELADILSLLAQPQDAFSSNLLSGHMTAGGAMTMDDVDINPGDYTNTPSGGDGSTNSYTPGVVTYPTNVLWIEVPTNSLTVAGQFCVVLHNTTEDAPYDVLTSTNLALPLSQWAVDQFTFGVEGTNCSPVTLVLNGRSNLFVNARFGGSSDGSGLPDWWELEYFGTNGVDPFADDPSGDGWTYLDDFQKGFVPGTWNTPKPPQNLDWHFDATGTNAVLTWDSGGGDVDHFEIDAGAGEIGETDSSTLDFTTGVSHVTDSLSSSGYRRVTAVYANGERVPSGYVPVGQLASLDRDCQIVRGASGKFYLTIPNIPQDLARVHVFWPSFSGGVPDLSFDIDSSNIVNGTVQMPDVADESLLTVDYPTVQLVDEQNRYSQYIRFLSNIFPDERDYVGPWPTVDFVNASSHMKENLKFLLRAAGVFWPFGYSSGLSYNGSYEQDYPLGEDAYGPDSMLARGTASTNYEYYGFHTFSPYLGYSFIDELRPVQENFLWRNFVYNSIDYTNDLDYGYPEFDTATADYDTGVNWNSGIDNLSLGSLVWPIVNVAKYQYTGTGSETPLPLAFDSTSSGWIFHAGDPESFGGELGTIWDGSVYRFGTGVKNIYGLGLNSAYVDTNLATAGATVPNGLWTFENYTMPDLQIVDYYFNSQTPFFNYILTYPYTGSSLALPGAPNFTTTSTSPLLITGIGQRMTVSGWAKMTIANGDTNKFGYLEQYFDRAYSIATNGSITTNSAGLLSPYGDFFPTAPGPTALVTMPDINTGARGTGVVNVIKLQLDVNHDGTMDLSFGGPDNTSEAHPFAFWINDDTDEGGFPLSPGKEEFSPESPDYAYSNPQHGNGLPCMRSQRDLEDYARMWICGLPALTNSNYQITLSWTNVQKGNPSIALFQAVETDGGVSYLTETNVAATQLVIPGPGRSIGQVVNGQAFVFPANYFSDGMTKSLLFEGASVGSGELRLTIFQGTNIIAQTSAWVELDRVKDMFERAHIEGAPSTNNVPPTVSLNDESTYKEDDFVPVNTDDGKQLVVFVHGWRLTEWTAENFAETMFKRLWWQGYQGRFAALHYPTLSSATDGVLGQFFTFNRDEYIAFKCGQGAANYFLRLQSRFPDYTINACSHSHGAIVMMEALKTHLLNGQTPIHNYVLMQAAVAAECFDTNAPAFFGFFGASPSTPDFFYGYPGYLRQAISGTMVNFYNTNDFGAVLAWQADQVNYKPDSLFGYLFDPSSGFPERGIITPRIVSDPHEIMAFLSRPKTQAVGGMADLAGPFTTSLQVDLTTLVGFGEDWGDHSGEFNSNIQTVSPFYKKLGQRLEVIP